MKRITGLEAIAERYDAFFLDLFGVLHNGARLFPDTLATLDRLRHLGKQTCILTNTPHRNANCAAQNESMGLPRDHTSAIMTAGESAHLGLARHVADYGSRCWFLGPDFAAPMLEGLGIERADGPEEADFFVNAVSTRRMTLPEGELEAAAARRLPMICPNPDMVVDIDGTTYETPGTAAARYERMGGTVHYHGKPYEPVYEMAREKLGSPDKARICAVGDSLHTDIQGANRFGIDSIFVLSGIHGGEAAEIDAAIARQPHRPTYILETFKW